jgi:hypothetical protein
MLCELAPICTTADAKAYVEEAVKRSKASRWRGGGIYSGAFVCHPMDTD